MPRALLNFLAMSLALITVPAFALVERRIERRFETALNAAVDIDTFSGAVRVSEDANAKAITVVVIQTSEVATEAEMDSRLRALTFDLGQKKDGVVFVSARYRRPMTWSWKSWPPVNLVYEIKVPHRCDVRVSTREGSIVIGSLEGRVVLANETGSIFTGEIQGSVTVRSNSGEVAITAASGEIDASTSTGSMLIGRAGDHTRLSSQGGYIEVQRASGELVVRGNGSDAKVGFASPIKHSADIVLSGGGLSLVMETNSACTLNVRSSMFGRVGVRGDIPLQIVSGGEGRTHLEATVNGGGPRIAARASGGNVIVRGVEPLPPVNMGSSSRDVSMR